MTDGWISVRNWRHFQHYDPAKRQPRWIKNYTELMHSDAYLSLKASERAILHGIWLEYASSQCQLKFDPVSLTRRLNLRVRIQHLETLVYAGFIDVVASKLLADGYQLASPEVEGEEEKEKDLPSSNVNVHPNGRKEGGIDHEEQPPLPEWEPILKDIPA